MRPPGTLTSAHEPESANVGEAVTVGVGVPVGDGDGDGDGDWDGDGDDGESVGDRLAAAEHAVANTTTRPSTSRLATGRLPDLDRLDGRARKSPKWPPTMRARPSGKAVVVCDGRGPLKVPATEKLSVSGSHSSTLENRVTRRVFRDELAPADDENAPVREQRGRVLHARV